MPSSLVPIIMSSFLHPIKRALTNDTYFLSSLVVLFHLIDVLPSYKQSTRSASKSLPQPSSFPKLISPQTDLVFHEATYSGIRQLCKTRPSIRKCRLFLPSVMYPTMLTSATRPWTWSVRCQNGRPLWGSHHSLPGSYKLKVGWLYIVPVWSSGEKGQ